MFFKKMKVVEEKHYRKQKIVWFEKPEPIEKSSLYSQTCMELWHTFTFGLLRVEDGRGAY